MSENINLPSVKAKITWMNDDPTGAKKAAASIILGNVFQVHGLSIVEGPKGLFLSMPQRQTSEKSGERKFLEIAHPITAEMRKAINDAVFNAYSQTLAISDQYKAVFQKTSGSSKVSTPEESATKTELPFEVSPADAGEDLSEVEDEDEDQVQIMGQMM